MAASNERLQSIGLFLCWTISSTLIPTGPGAFSLDRALGLGTGKAKPRAKSKA